jgi:DNA-binding response OmpR family regulator
MIDDSELALEVQVMMLERKGFEVRGCLDLAAMREAAASFLPDAVVTDVGLADATIEEACAAIRQSFGDEIPLLLYSGREDHELEALVKSLDVDGFINKADEQATVVAKIEAAIRLAQL